MATKLTLSGIVINKGTNERISNAIVSMQTTNNQLVQYTNEDGKFEFKDVEEPDLTQEELQYNISLNSYSKHSKQQNPVPLIIDIDKGQNTHFQIIKLLNRGPISSISGILFLIGLVVTLVITGYIYFNLHIDSTRNQQVVNSNMVNTLIENLESQITSDSVKISELQLKNSLIDTTDVPLIKFKLQQLNEATNELFKIAYTDSSFQALVYRNLNYLEVALNRKSQEDIIVSLYKIKNLVRDVPNLSQSWFWESKPLIYVEVLFWALIATLLRLISNTSYYISRNTFFRDGILHKTVLLFTIPLIALLITLVISFFKVTISIGGTNISLDFSNVFVSIIIAFLIGLAPWKSWEFIYELADKLFNGLKKWLSLGKPSDQKSEGEETDSNNQNSNTSNP